MPGEYNLLVLLLRGGTVFLDDKVLMLPVVKRFLEDLHFFLSAKRQGRGGAIRTLWGGLKNGLILKVHITGSVKCDLSVSTLLIRYQQR